MQLNALAFNTHLRNMGQAFDYRKADACPCIQPHSGAALADCPHCRGLGHIWASPIRSHAAVSSSKTQREWAGFGQWENGDMVLSVPSDSKLYGIGQFDRVVAVNNTDVFSMPFTRGHNDVLRFTVMSVTRVFWIDGDSIVEGGIPTVDAAGVMTWRRGEPAAGMQYTVTGTRFVEYYCYGAYPGDRNMHFGAQLPRRTILRRFDLLGRQPGGG